MNALDASVASSRRRAKRSAPPYLFAYTPEELALWLRTMLPVLANVGSLIRGAMLIEKKKDYAPAHQTAATLYTVAAHRLFEEMTLVDAAVRRMRRQGEFPSDKKAAMSGNTNEGHAVRSARKKRPTEGALS